MKNFMIIVMCFITFIANAQIYATTSSGKNVILNSDGTWKYATPADNENPCSKNHTGSLSIKNSTGGDLYFYYAITDLDKSEFIKVKAHSTKTVDDIHSGVIKWNGTIDGIYNWKWRAAPELQGNVAIAYIRGAIESGSFIITDCEVKQINIGE